MLNKHILQENLKRIGSGFLGWATIPRLFTGAIPLLINVETFGCSLSGLAQYVSP